MPATVATDLKALRFMLTALLREAKKAGVNMSKHQAADIVRGVIERLEEVGIFEQHQETDTN